MQGTGQQGKYCLDKGVGRYNKVNSRRNSNVETMVTTNASPFATMVKVRMTNRFVRLTVERLLADRTVRGFRRYLHKWMMWW